MTNSQKVIVGYLLLASVEAGAGIISQLIVPSNLENRFVLGYSLSRLVLIIVFFLAFGLLAMLTLRAWRDPSWVERNRQRVFSSPQRVSRLLWVFGTTLALLVTILLIPMYRFGAWDTYAERLSPVVWWCALVNAQTFLGILFGREQIAERRQTHFLGNALSFSGIAFLILMLILIWVAQTKIGVVSSTRTPWYPIGVPLLPGQVWLIGWLTLAIVAGGALWHQFWPMRQKEHRRKWNANFLIGLGIWAVTALLWFSATLPRNFFFPGPYPPDNVIYPYADSAIWDMGGQFALIGQGFANGDAFQDHSGYMGILAFLHLLLGQDYLRISIVQAGLLAIFPALMYWLGKTLHSRSAGLLIAGLTIAHELNAFTASSMIDLSHARFLLTEYPIRVGLGVLALLLFIWLRAPRHNIAYAIPIGGLLACMILLRYNTLAIPLAVMAGVILILGRDWKSWFHASLLIIISLALVLSPWMWRSWKISGNPFFFLDKSQLLFNENFRNRPPVTPTPPSTSSPSSQILFETNQFISSKQPIQFDYPAGKPLNNSLVSSVTGDSPSVFQLILSHFMHNLVASTLVLPTNILFHDVQHTIYEVHPYWEKNNNAWHGDLTLQETMLLIVNLALISIGLGASWHRWKLAGLVPLGVCLAYVLSLAAARTSGGRYIVPMDWGVLFYWGIGITQIVHWGAAWFGVSIEEPHSLPQPAHLSYRKSWLYFLPFLLFVGAMTVMDQTVPQRYSEMSKTDVLNLLMQTETFQQTNITAKELNAFINQKNSQALLGRGLYPRFYGINQGEHSGGVDAYEPGKYPRLAFTLIGEFGRKDIVLPWMVSNSSVLNASRFPNASDVIIIGCQRSMRGYRNVIDALFIVLLGDEPLVYVRNPSAPFKCPVPEPICEANNSCR